MRVGGYLFFLRRNLRRHLFRTSLSITGIALATGFIFLTVALTLSLLHEVYPRVEAAFPEKEIKVRPAAQDIALFRFSSKSLNRQTVDKIRKINGVEAVYPVLPLRVSARAEARVFGQQGVSTDVVIYGVAPELLQDAAVGGRSFSYHPERPLPVIIPEYFLDLYNMGFAEANGLPKFSAQSVIGRNFTLILGESTVFMGSGEPLDVRSGVIAGLTQRSGLLGGFVPIEYVRQINRKYAGEDAENYSQAIVRVRSLADYNHVTAELEKMKLAFSGSLSMLRNVRSVIFGALLVFTLICAAVLALALFGLFNAFCQILNERQKLIGITRAVGAGRGAVRLLLLSEALFAGICGGVLGCAAGHGIGNLINAQLENWVESLTIVPQHLFIADWEAWTIGFSLAVAGAVLTPLIMIWRETLKLPARQLGGSA